MYMFLPIVYLISILRGIVYVSSTDKPPALFGKFEAWTEYLQAVRRDAREIA